MPTERAYDTRGDAIIIRCCRCPTPKKYHDCNNLVDGKVCVALERPQGSVCKFYRSKKDTPKNEIAYHARALLGVELGDES